MLCARAPVSNEPCSARSTFLQRTMLCAKHLFLEPRAHVDSLRLGAARGCCRHSWQSRQQCATHRNFVKTRSFSRECERMRARHRSVGLAAPEALQGSGTARGKHARHATTCYHFLEKRTPPPTNTIPKTNASLLLCWLRLELLCSHAPLESTGQNLRVCQQGLVPGGIARHPTWTVR